MAGSKAGGLKAAATNKRLYGEDFYSRQGRKGGAGKHRPGSVSGFRDRELASRAGAKGGKISRRGSNKSKMETTWVTKKQGSVSSNSTLKTSHKGTCLECGNYRLSYLNSGFCQRDYKRLGKLGRELVYESQAINRGEKSNNYETVTVPGWEHLDDKPEFIIDTPRGFLDRLFGRRHRR